MAAPEHPAPGGRAAPAPYRRALVLANPIAGRGRGRPAAEELARGLGELGVASEVHLTTGRGDARRRASALEPSFDLVACVGGDGTLGEVLAGLGDRDVPVAVLPAGTANVLSIDLDLPREVDGLVRAIAGGRTRCIDTARVNGERLSFLATSVGLDAAIVREVERRRHGPITKSTYVSAGLRAFRSYRAPRLAVEADGTALDGTFGEVLVSNVVNYAGFRVLSADRRLDDGLYEVYLFRKGSRSSLLATTVRAIVRGLPGGSCTRIRARRVRITSESPVPCQVDGDAFGTTPVEIAVHSVQSRLVVP
jgi:YegS/Rv2252/BmrU family lipid kinase